MLLGTLTVGVRAEIRVPDHFILGGELGNSSASSKEDIVKIFPELKDMGLNTVLMPAYWELIEPEEGKYDFSLIDEALKSAEENDLNIVLLWFGAWKNSMSCYAPGWVKTDTKRFPRAVTKEGKPLEILSAFSKNVADSDLSAFTALLHHLEATDKNKRVSMIQIENEIGMLESARDHSPLADAAYNKGVPERLSSILNVKKGSPWTDATVDPDSADEMFMAWNYACYVENLAKAARKILPATPLYVNAAMDSRGRRPGQYPSAGPLAKLEKIWKAGAPSIDFISPDLYDPPFKPWFAQYDMEGNPLFIPEIRRSSDSGTHAFYAVGEHGAIGFSPFSIENASQEEKASLRSAYSLLGKIAPLRKGRSSFGLLFEGDDIRTPKEIADGDVIITASHFFTLPWDARATDGSRWPDGGGMIIKLAKDDYLIAGRGIVVKFEAEGETGAAAKLGEDGFQLGNDSTKQSSWTGRNRIGILSCDEVDVNPDGSFRVIRRLNGDETHQGRHVRIGVDDYSALRVKLYRY